MAKLIWKIAGYLGDKTASASARLADALERVSRATSIVGHLLIGSTMGGTACFGHAAEPYGSWSLYHAGRQKRALKLGLARGGRIAVASTERGRGALICWRRGATPSPGRAGIR